MESSSRGQKLLLVFLVLIVIELSPRIGTLIADRYQNLLVFMDPDHVISWEIIHHIVQLLIPLTIMILWPGRPLRDWGFQMGDSSKGWRWVFRFTAVWFGIYFLITLAYMLQHAIPNVYYDVAHTRNLLGELGFRTFLVGLSEETLFRAFPITILIVFLNRQFEIFRFNISQAGIIAAILFCYAHIAYQIYPFKIININIAQLVTAAGLGLIYAIVFEETKSILYPIIIHSISDVIPVLGVFVIQVMNR